MAVPTVTSITPHQGPAAGGTSVVIIGTDFGDPTSDPTPVCAFYDSYPSGPSANLTVTGYKPTEIKAVTPARPSGMGPNPDLAVTISAGTGFKIHAWVYV